MSKLISALFPEGQRKVMVNLLIVLIGVIIEKFAGGLSDNLSTMLISVAAIFTGGNVLSNLGGILGGLKGTKVGQIIEDIIPGDQGLGSSSAQAASAPARVSAEEVAEASEERFADLEKKLAVQTQNIGQIVQILNQMRSAGAGPKPPGTA